MKATDVEGIFRLSGSAKRIKDLQTIFNSPERYGKGLDWTGYTVHDAANILRRYLNQLPEPIVPLQYYEQFRDPLRAYQAKVGNSAQAQAMENQEHTRAVVAYQKLITKLPALNRQLLLYILDLLAVFASKSDLNRMTAQNLAAIFQPGIISHPNHDMAPNEYRLSQDVLIFLIENQDNFLIGMTGTAMDEKTKDEVKSGPPSIQTPKPAIGRSASTASAGADSIRRTGGVRRNGSMSSRNSRGGSPGVSGPGTPVSPSALSGAPGGGGAGGGLARSNTVPSNRSPALTGSRFQRISEASPSGTFNANAPVSGSALFGGGPGSGIEESSIPETLTGGGPGASSSPIPEQPAESVLRNNALPTRTIDTRVPSNQSASDNNVIADGLAPPTALDSRPTQDSASTTPVSNKPDGKDRKISNLLSISPIFGPSDQSRDPSQRQPRKLQKRRIPGSHNESAQSSQASLHAEEGGASNAPMLTPNSLAQERANPMENHSPSTPNAVATPTTDQILAPSSATSPTGREARTASRSLMPPHSPTPSMHSRGSATDPSDLDALEDPTLREEKRRNKFRSSIVRSDSPLAPPPPIGQLPGARTSNSSLGSNRPRKSFTGDSQLTQTSAADASSSAGYPSFTNISSHESTEMLKEQQAEPEKKGLFGRFKAKMSQTKEHFEAERDRAKSPPRMYGENASSRASLSAFKHEHLAGRGRSFDGPREESLPTVQTRPQTQKPDEKIAVGQPPVITQVQPPTPAPASSSTVTTSPAVSSSPPMQAQLLHSQTFPLSGAPPPPLTSTEPEPGTAAQDSIVAKDVAPSEEERAAPTPSAQESREAPIAPVILTAEQGKIQESPQMSASAESESPVKLSEQVESSGGSGEPRKDSSLALENDPSTLSIAHP